MIKPSDVKPLPGICPFPGAMGSLELEIAALTLIRFLRDNGDEWRPVGPAELSGWLRALVDREPDDPFVKLLNNPFAGPDFQGLVTKGYAFFEGISIALLAEGVQACALSGGGGG